MNGWYFLAIIVDCQKVAWNSEVGKPNLQVFANIMKFLCIATYLKSKWNWIEIEIE